jgi:hypothetical protein
MFAHCHVPQPIFFHELCMCPEWKSGFFQEQAMTECKVQLPYKHRLKHSRCPFWTVHFESPVQYLLLHPWCDWGCISDDVVWFLQRILCI